MDSRKRNRVSQKRSRIGVPASQALVGAPASKVPVGTLLSTRQVPVGVPAGATVVGVPMIRINGMAAGVSTGMYKTEQLEPQFYWLQRHYCDPVKPSPL